jgi:hypothetical protein
MKNISNDRVTNMVLSCPPLDEQRSVVGFPRRELEHSRRIERTVAQQITKLQKYRQTLIEAAVTDRIEAAKEAAC